MLDYQTRHLTEDQILEKSPTGIKGLDQLLGGGLPKGRSTLVCGAAGCGKTLLGVEFLVRGALEFGEPGVFMLFEETPEELSRNVASLGVDLQALVEGGQILMDFVHVERAEIEETGAYDLEGLFVRLGYAMDTIGAKRVVIDTVEALFSGFSNEGILRAELRRLFRWLKEKGVTAIITAERGEGTLTRHGLEEYISDCVILLDHRVQSGLASRILRVVKYRGSRHGNDEYPFLIDAQGIRVMPITSVGLDYPVSSEFISSGVPRLDSMLNGKGYYRGSSILISGTAGTGKSSLAAQLVDAACRRGERCLYFAYEESPSQVIRNMRSIGIDLGQWVEADLLRFIAARPSFYSAEMHLLVNEKATEEFQPSVIVLDPITNLISLGTEKEVQSLLVRMIDFFKMNQITTLFTSLTHGGAAEESTEVGVSSLMDTWLLLRDIEINGERNRGLYILKSRGMPHSNQIREFLLTDGGIQLVDIYVGAGGALTGSARLALEASERADALQQQRELQRRRRELDYKRQALQAQISALQAEFEVQEAELERFILETGQREDILKEDRQETSRLRWGDHEEPGGADLPGKDGG